MTSHPAAWHPAASHPREMAPSTTRATWLRDQVADDIVHGILLPGTPLDESGLARRFGVSRTPVREALRELAVAGLVRMQPHRGAVVARPTVAEVEDMFAVMAELEAICASLAAVRMTPRERQVLADIHESLRSLIQTNDPQRYHEVNEEFHKAIYLGSHNAYLVEVTLTTRKRLAPFRRAQFRMPGRLLLSYQEHDRVVRAIQQGDRKQAADSMRDHIGIVHFAYEHYAHDGVLAGAGPSPEPDAQEE